MAVTLQATDNAAFGSTPASGGEQATNTTAITVDAGSDRCLVVLIEGEGDGTAAGAEVSSITYNGVGLTQNARVEATAFSWAEIWRLVAPATGANNLVITLNEADNFNVKVLVAQGVDQTTPLRTGVTATGTSTSATATVLSVTADDLVFSILGLDGTGHNPTPGTNETEVMERDSTIGGTEGAAYTQPGANGGVMNPAWTTSCPYSFAASAFIAVASGTTESPTPGGGTAAGVGPTSNATAAPGGAPAAGVAPAPRATAGTGGATSAGTGPAVRATAGTGGATSGGVGPTALVPAGTGGATAGGVGPSDGLTVTESPTPGGARASGRSGGVLIMALGMAGSLAAGPSPSAGVALSQGAASSGGNGPGGFAGLTPGGGSTAGTGPGAAAGPTTGGATAAGVGAVARALMDRGGAIAGGQLDDPLASPTEPAPIVGLPTRLGGQQYVAGTVGSNTVSGTGGGNLSTVSKGAVVGSTTGGSTVSTGVKPGTVLTGVKTGEFSTDAVEA